MQIEELNQLVKEAVAARDEYKRLDKIAKDAYHARRAKEKLVLDALSADGKKRWDIPGVGTVSCVDKLNVQVPKTIEDKKATWQYIVDKYGEDLAFEKFSVNSKTLGSFYRQELKAADDPSLFEIPGVQPPTSEVEYRFKGVGEKEEVDSE